MRGGPGRVLPSVIVGGLLVGGLALGMGTAVAAADTCTDGPDTYDITNSTEVGGAGGPCVLKSGATSTSLSAALNLLTKIPAASTGSTAGGTTTGGATSGGTATAGGT